MGVEKPLMTAILIIDSWHLMVTIAIPVPFQLR